MSYQYNNKNSTGTSYTNWTSNRGSSTQQLQNLPPITNTANGTRYYSSIDAEIYFGDIYVGEITNIAWNISQQSLPLYGYNSYTFDDVAVGSRIIQGQFAINFTQRNFLSKLQSNASFQKIARREYGEDNPVVCNTYSDFRQKLHMPVWDKGFDIVIGFGEGNTKLSNYSEATYSTYLVLNCVQVTGSSIQLDYNGDPIQEVYSFFARDIKETMSDATAADPSSVNSEKLTVTTDTGDDLTLTGTIDLTKSSAQVYVSTTNNITFTAGTFMINDVVTNSSLKQQVGFTIDKTQVYRTLNTADLVAYKKEFSAKDNVKAFVDLTYIVNSSSANKGKTVNVQKTIVFKIKNK